MNILNREWTQMDANEEKRNFEKQRRLVGSLDRSVATCPKGEVP
jgi:hypothetical protein